MNVLLIDDHALFRSGMRYLLADLDRELHFLEAGSVAEALALADRPVDLVLLDLVMPDASGDGAIADVRAAFDRATLVVISSEEDPRLVRRAIELGASGFVPKTSSPRILPHALRLVLAGGVYLPPHVLRERDFASPPPLAATPVAGGGPPRIEGLSERQTETLLRAVLGRSNKSIAREMDVSEGTVKAHLTVAYRVLGVTNRTEAVYAVARLGLSAAPAPAR